MEELKEFIKEAKVEENLLSTAPISEIDIQAMRLEDRTRPVSPAQNTKAP